MPKFDFQINVKKSFFIDVQNKNYAISLLIFFVLFAFKLCIFLLESLSYNHRAWGKAIWCWHSVEFHIYVCSIKDYGHQISFFLNIPNILVDWADEQLWGISGYFLHVVKVSKFQKQFMVSSILQKNEQNSLSWASSLLRIVSFVHFLGESRRPEIAFEIYWPLLSA